MTVRTRILACSLFAIVFGAGRPPLWAGVEAVRPAMGKALVCFYREEAFQGNLFKYRVSDGSRAVGTLSANRWLFYQAEPGEHRFQVSFLRSGAINLRVLPNHIYYLRCDPAQEVFYARPQPRQVPVVEGAAIVGFMPHG